MCTTEGVHNRCVKRLASGTNMDSPPSRTACVDKQVSDRSFLFITSWCLESQLLNVQFVYGWSKAMVTNINGIEHS
jgi:hypothetical protein